MFLKLSLLVWLTCWAEGAMLKNPRSERQITFVNQERLTTAHTGASPKAVDAPKFNKKFFNESNKEDREMMQTLTLAWLESGLFAEYGMKAVNSENSLKDKFFPPEHLPKKNKFGHIEYGPVYHAFKIVYERAETFFGNVYFDKDEVDEPRYPNRIKCDTDMLFHVQQNRDREDVRIVVCESFTKFPLTFNRRCDEMGPRPDRRMVTLGGGIMHELLHVLAVGEAIHGKSGWEEQIVDWRYNVTPPKASQEQWWSVYGPGRTRYLRKDDPLNAMENADNYTWLAMEYYWRTACDDTKKWEEPPEEPKPKPKALKADHVAPEDF